MIKEGALMKVCRKVNKKRYFYLFNDAIVYATIVSPTQQKFNRLLNMLGKKTRVKDMEDQPGIFDWSLEIYFPDRNKECSANYKF